MRYIDSMVIDVSAWKVQGDGNYESSELHSHFPVSGMIGDALACASIMEDWLKLQANGANLKSRNRPDNITIPHNHNHTQTEGRNHSSALSLDP